MYTTELEIFAVSVSILPFHDTVQRKSVEISQQMFVFRWFVCVCMGVNFSLHSVAEYYFLHL